MATRFALEEREALARVSAREVAPKLAFDERGNSARVRVALPHLRQELVQVLAHQPVEQGLPGRAKQGRGRASVIWPKDRTPKSLRASRSPRHASRNQSASTTTPRRLRRLQRCIEVASMLDLLSIPETELCVVREARCGRRGAFQRGGSIPLPKRGDRPQL